MVIAVDTNQFNTGSHYESNLRKHRALQNAGCNLVTVPLPVGDYTELTDKMMDVIKRKEVRGTKPKKMDFLGSYDIVIDTKKSLVEVAGNICNKKGHERFVDELILAQNNGIEFWLVIENSERVYELKDLFAKGKQFVQESGWKQTKYGEKWLPIHRTKVPCLTLAKALYTMEQKYGIHIVFCKPKDAAETIVKILEQHKEKSYECSTVDGKTC